MGLARIERQYMDMVAIWFGTLAFTSWVEEGMCDRAAYLMTRVCSAKA